ncbi:MAG: UbiH/UbiF/VisC/COQ6 family ubiquinone biosynthesis hydroxylase [Pseudomonadota bacterium]
MAEDFEILVAGAGLAGTLMALALSQAGFHSALIDAGDRDVQSEPGFDGRAYALSLSSVRMLEALGLWSDIAEDAEPILGIRASDGRPGEGASHFFLDFDAAELEEGPMGHIVEDRILRPALLSASANDPRIKIKAQSRIVDQDTGVRASVTLSDGETLSGRLLIGADGRESQVATRAGIQRTGWAYRQTALVAAIAHENPHHGIAHQFFMPAGPLAILPLPGNRSSIVWSEDSDAASKVFALPDAAFLDHLRPRFGDFRGEISLAGKRYRYPLGLSLADRFVAPGLALVGDAAHGIHPIAGQGLNLGFRDIAALAQVIAEAASRGEDIGASDVLARYQSWRRFDTTALAVATDGFNRLFSNDNPILRGIRDLGMGFVNASPALKRQFMREAAGLSGDLPQLLTGRPL